MGIGGLGGSLPSVAALLVCMSVDRRASAREIYLFLHFRRSVLTDWMIGGKGIPASHYSQRQHVWFACQRIGRESASEVLFCSFSHSIFPERGAGCGEVSVSLHSAAALSV